MNRFIALAAGLLFGLSSLATGAEPRGVIYKFGATWCGPCRQVAPLVERLERAGMPIQSVDIDQDRQLADRYGIQSIPTFVLVIDGKEVDRHTGAMTESDLRRMAARIPAAPPTNPVAAPVSAPRTPGSPSGPANGSGFQIQLGEPAPLPRSTPAPLRTQPEETRVVMNEEKKGIRDLWPFGKKTAEAETEADVPPTIRGNNESTEPAAVAMDADTAPTVSDPMHASVRIRVITNKRINLGSGTVISSKAGITHILTCAHIFKGFTTESKIEVDLFENGRPSPYVAKLIQFEEDSDLGLIAIPTSNVVPAVPVGLATSSPRLGEPLAAIGCSGGDDPTRQQSQVAAVDRYDGPHNILCTGLPVQGRSGGGLFNRRGEIVGVCSAADHEKKEGFYSGLLAIRKFLTDCGMLAPANSPAPVEESPASLLAAAPATQPAPVTPAAQPAPEPASMASSMRDPLNIQAADAEAVVIIRSKSNPQAENRVVIFHDVSPKFYSYLSGELEPGAANTMLSQRDETPAMPAIPRSMRVDAANTLAHQPLASKGQLEPTALTQPAPVQRYVRSASSR